MTKKILGLDLGTNSIGWALLESDFDNKEGKIIGLGSRIIPMDQGILGDFDKGNSVSQTADRTSFRGVRRLRQRSLLRRERLHRILNVIEFLPDSFCKHIDFEKRKGQFINGKEVRLAYNEDNEFLFIDSFNEMLEDFRKSQPSIVSNNKEIPNDWTIYYLRKKALDRALSKEELAYLILNFNQKRGYYQLRGEEEEETKGKLVEFHSLIVEDCYDTGEFNKKKQMLYKIVLENKLEFIKPTNTALDWKGKRKEFIISTDINEDGSVKLDKFGDEKRSFRVPKEDDWTLVKKKTEHNIELSNKTVGSYIYDNILVNPSQKIKGKLVRTIERNYYKNELERILEKQKEFHPELTNSSVYQKCLLELYPNNEVHRNNIKHRDLAWFITNDIIFYQRPLKSKKSLIAGCPYESRVYKKDGELVRESIKCVSKSHPIFQEFRLWQFIKNLKIHQREGVVDGKHKMDINVTSEFINSDNDNVDLYEILNKRKEIDQKAFLRIFKLKEDKYRWNFVEDKKYPCNETRTAFFTRFKKAKIADSFLTESIEVELWHLLYSISDREELHKALHTFSNKYDLPEEFFEQFKKFPPFDNDYASYSLKAINKLLPLMRTGKYWDEELINKNVIDRIKKIIDGEYDDSIKTRVRDKAINLTDISMFKNLPLWLSSYIVYDRHSENGDIVKWKMPQEIELLKQHSLRNPIVEQIVNETLQVVKDIWVYYGNGKENFFDEIHVELGREMKNPASVRDSISKQNFLNENTNARIKALLRELKNEGVDEVRPYSPSQQEKLKIYEEGVFLNDNTIPDDIEKIRRNTSPSLSEIKKYKLWLEQGYISPYTGQMIPLCDLFTRKYEIEHVIPQAKYFDDSLSNKVVCESVVNSKKGSQTAYAMILKHGGELIELEYGKSVNLLSISAYESHIKKYFSKNKSKMEKLLSEDIPEGFINRQLNDSRYISKLVKSLLSNVVRENDELEVTSKNIVTLAGSITSRLKHDWGLNDVWNSIVSPRFERLNLITSSDNYGEWKEVNGSRFFQTRVPDEVSRGFNKKRIDHRHHTLDAIVIACATKDHISYITSLNTQRENHSLIKKLRVQEEWKGKPIAKKFHKPWKTFTEDTRDALQSTLVSFKKNTRVINKTKNYYQKWKTNSDGELKKVLQVQTKGDNWAIRKPMHKETVYGRVNIQEIKSVNLSKAIENWESIKDKPLRKKIRSLLATGNDIQGVKKYFKENKNIFRDCDIKKVEIYINSNEYVASRSMLDETFNSKKIESVTDKGIQKILKNHLIKFNITDAKGKLKEQPEIAFSQDGIEEMNSSLDGHKPIYKVRTYETMGKKFIVGQEGNKRKKYVEAAKGTNLFFAVYADKAGNRTYDTVQLNIVIERQKQGLISVPELDIKENPLSFYLSPNDLVYVPNEDEIEGHSFVDFENLSKEQTERVYKVVSFTGNQCFFICNNISTPIINKVEYSALNKMEKSIDEIMIKQICWKLKVDRIGNIIGIER